MRSLSRYVKQKFHPLHNGLAAILTKQQVFECGQLFGFTSFVQLLVPLFQIINHDATQHFLSRALTITGEDYQGFFSQPRDCTHINHG
jgi:hypothetical protein